MSASAERRQGEASTIVDSVENLTERADRCSLRLIDAVSPRSCGNGARPARGVVRTRAPPRSPKLLGIGYDPAMEDGDANLMELARRCTLSPVLIRMWIEAATVMLFKFHRAPPPRTRLSLHWDERRCSLHLDWSQPHRQALESHANEKDATEAGAYAVAIAAADHDGYVVRRRATRDRAPTS